jgi:hypothetical protein
VLKQVGLFGVVEVECHAAVGIDRRRVIVHEAIKPQLSAARVPRTRYAYRFLLADYSDGSLTIARATWAAESAKAFVDAVKKKFGLEDCRCHCSEEQSTGAYGTSFCFSFA